MMKTRDILSVFILMILLISCSSGMNVSSPDKNNVFKLILNKQGELQYKVKSGSEILVDNSLMGLISDDSIYSFTKGLRMVSVSHRMINESYKLPLGKCSSYKNYANEKTFVFSNNHEKKLEVICRAYNDGIAFRYSLQNVDSLNIKKEATEIAFRPNTKTWMMNWIRHYENYYPERLIDTITQPKEFLFPVLFRQNNRWALATEASVYDIPAMHLSKEPYSSTMQLMYDKSNASFTIHNKFLSSWKVFIMGKSLKTIVESTLVENLNPPSVIDSTDWIIPGVAVFPWWGDHLANSDINTLKEYVDLAADMKWKWIEFDVSLINSPLRASKEWRNVNWIPSLTQYAKQRGIKVYGWDEIKTLDNPIERNYVFDRYKEMGIDGIKIDYIDSDSQNAMKFRNMICREAAKRKLMVSFHGETLPRGQRRKYPNIMAHEAVRGAEYYTFAGYPCPNARHNCTLPFTRNVVGPMDYTPVTFTIRKENPRTTTYCHELALPFVFESGWMCMADSPKAYLESPARPLLEKIVTAWDEIKYIDGYPGEYFCVARRKGLKWFVAAINSDDNRELKIPLHFLSKGIHKLTVYSDKDGDEMHSCSLKTLEVNSDDILKMALRPNGGFVIDVDP